MSPETCFVVHMWPTDGKSYAYFESKSEAEDYLAKRGFRREGGVLWAKADTCATIRECYDEEES